MKVPTNKQVIFLDEYKEGFNELARLVNEFEGMTGESQSLYLEYVEESIKEQLALIEQKKNEVLAEAKKFLAKYNSQFKALLDTENHLNSQLINYKNMRTVITNEDGQRTNERAAI